LSNRDFYGRGNEQAAPLRAGKKAQLPQSMREVYRLAMVGTPRDCPYPFERAMNADLWPE
jgi:hypothetical protein